MNRVICTYSLSDRWGAGHTLIVYFCLRENRTSIFSIPPPSLPTFSTCGDSEFCCFNYTYTYVYYTHTNKLFLIKRYIIICIHLRVALVTFWIIKKCV